VCILGQGNVKGPFVFLEHHYWSSPPLTKREISLPVPCSRIRLIPALDNKNHYSGVMKPSTEASGAFLMVYQYIITPGRLLSQLHFLII